MIERLDGVQWAREETHGVFIVAFHGSLEELFSRLLALADDNGVRLKSVAATGH